MQGMPPAEKDRDSGRLRSPVKLLSGFGAAANASGSGPHNSHAAAAVQQPRDDRRRTLHPATPETPELPTLALCPEGQSLFVTVTAAFSGTISRDQSLGDDFVRRRLSLAPFEPKASRAGASGQSIGAEAAVLLAALDEGPYGELAV
ncbi:hypothetical protein OC844_004275, partial [Tilletia horrida]